jgi:predicted MFS family arabinose efflux permease
VSVVAYRQVLALPSVAPLLSFAVLARVPLTSSGVIVTLHVVTTLHRGYGAAGLVAAVATIGTGVGGPWRGRAVDRIGLRRSVLPCVVVATVAWGLSPFASYSQLLALGFVGGLLGLPVFGITRQSLAVLVPGDQRRTAFSLDAIGTELSFIIGPSVGVLVATQFSTRVALAALAGLTLLMGLALLALNPPTRSEPEPVVPGAMPPDRRRAVQRSAWFTPRLLAVLAVAVGATVVLAGTDVSIVAHLRAHGAVSMAGLIFGAWGAGSILGGVVYGSLRRQLSPFGMLLALALLTVPVGLATGPAVLMLTILPAAALCAPVITATIEGVSLLVPEQVRGEAMGWHGSALQAGSTLGAPLAGVAIDACGAAAGFAVVGATGAVIAATGLVVLRRTGRTPPPQPAAAACGGQVLVPPAGPGHLT